MTNRGRWLALALLLLTYGAWDSWTHRPVHHSPGVLAADDPLQINLDPLPPRFDDDGYRLQPLAEFSMTARVLSRHDYRWTAWRG